MVSKEAHVQKRVNKLKKKKWGTLSVELEINNPWGHTLCCQYSCTIRTCCCFSRCTGSHLLTQASGESGNAKKKEKKQLIFIIKLPCLVSLYKAAFSLQWLRQMLITLTSSLVQKHQVCWWWPNHCSSWLLWLSAAAWEVCMVRPFFVFCSNRSAQVVSSAYGVIWWTSRWTT